MEPDPQYFTTEIQNEDEVPRVQKSWTQGTGSNLTPRIHIKKTIIRTSFIFTEQ